MRWIGRIVIAAVVTVTLAVAPAASAEDCSACRAKTTDNLLTFSPLLASNAALLASYTLLGGDGQPLSSDLYESMPITSPDTNLIVSPPIFRINQGISFRLLIDGRLLATPQPLKITLVGGGSTYSIDLQALNRQVVSDFSFNAESRVLALEAKGTASIAIQETHEELGLSFAFTGLMLRGEASGGIFMRAFATRRSLVFRENHGNASTWNITLTRTTINGSSIYRATGVHVPKNGQLYVSYATWTKRSGHPSLKVTPPPPPDHTSKPIPLHRL